MKILYNNAYFILLKLALDLNLFLCFIDIMLNFKHFSSTNIKKIEVQIMNK